MTAALLLRKAKEILSTFCLGDPGVLENSTDTVGAPLAFLIDLKSLSGRLVCGAVALIFSTRLSIDTSAMFSNFAVRHPIERFANGILCNCLQTSTSDTEVKILFDLKLVVETNAATEVAETDNAANIRVANLEAIGTK